MERMEISRRSAEVKAMQRIPAKPDTEKKTLASSDSSSSSEFPCSCPGCVPFDLYTLLRGRLSRSSP